MSIHAHPLHAGPLFRITDLDCRAHAAPADREEYASSHQVVFIRRGVFVKHVGRRQVVASPGRVIFFNHAEPFRVSHPIDGGDACTSVSCDGASWAELLSRYDPAAIDRPGTPFARSDTPLSAHRPMV